MSSDDLDLHEKIPYEPVAPSEDPDPYTTLEYIHLTPAKRANYLEKTFIDRLTSDADRYRDRHSELADKHFHLSNKYSRLSQARNSVFSQYIISTIAIAVAGATTSTGGFISEENATLRWSVLVGGWILLAYGLIHSFFTNYVGWPKNTDNE